MYDRNLFVCLDVCLFEYICIIVVVNDDDQRYDDQWYDDQWYDDQWYDDQWYDDQWYDMMNTNKYIINNNKPSTPINNNISNININIDNIDNINTNQQQY